VDFGVFLCGNMVYSVFFIFLKMLKQKNRGVIEIRKIFGLKIAAVLGLATAIILLCSVTAFAIYSPTADVPDVIDNEVIVIPENDNTEDNALAIPLTEGEGSNFPENVWSPPFKDPADKIDRNDYPAKPLTEGEGGRFPENVWSQGPGRPNGMIKK
jgi:hypothetical protein